ncbi:MAG: hypothetical protein ACK5MG_02330 [Bacteroidales bacterium]
MVVKTIIPESEVSKCGADFVEPEPGNYHCHEANEEVFGVYDK